MLNFNNKYMALTKSGIIINFADILIDGLDGLDGNTPDNIQLMKMINKIKSHFTIYYSIFSGEIRLRKRYILQMNHSRIIIPRFGLQSLEKTKSGLSGYGLDHIEIDNTLSIGHDMSNEFKCKINLTHNQQITANYLMNFIYTDKNILNGTASCILCMEAGQGKSYLAMLLISKFKKKTAIIIHTTSMIEQWVKVIKSTCPELSIGFYYNKIKTDGDINIIIVNSGCHEKFKFCRTDIDGIDETVEMDAFEYYDQFGFIIYDECHIYSSKKFSDVFRQGQSRCVIGLSATPDSHADGMDKIISWEIGNIIRVKDIEGYLDTTGNFIATIHHVCYYGAPDYTRLIKNSEDLTSIPLTINMICEDAIRNLLIVKCIMCCLEKNLYTFVFADRREYLEKLRQLLYEQNNTDGEIVVDDDDYKRIVGGSSSAELERAELKSKVIFTTYQYMGTGKSIVKMNGLVMATPRKNKMEQYVKRIFRLGSDASVERHIYDIVDCKTVLRTHYGTRRLFYEYNQYKIETSKHQFADVAKLDFGELF